jgi:hypothetical protein
MFIHFWTWLVTWSYIKSQVKSFSDLLRIRSSQVIFSSKISQVKSSQVTCDLTWLDSSQKLTWLAHVWDRDQKRLVALMSSRSTNRNPVGSVVKFVDLGRRLCRLVASCILVYYKKIWKKKGSKYIYNYALVICYSIFFC